MAKFSKLEVLSVIKQKKVIPLFYHKDIEVVKNVVSACYEGGIRVFEFTNRGDFAQEVFSELIKFVIDTYDDMILGVGSVIDSGTASIYLQLGANFIVSPYFDLETAVVCNKRLVPYMPGCMTIKEVANAQESGVDICKVFPGDVCGTAFIKSLLGPMPWTNIMVTGGVEPTEENINEWFSSGVSCIGIGSKLFPASVIENSAWDEIATLCKQINKIIKDKIK